tara:strand:- start:1251 stop:1874 length:624 start_codon:yes stop_codon:yes gene_type:complete
MNFSIKSLNYDFDDFVIIYFDGLNHKIVLLDYIIKNTIINDVFYKDKKPFDVTLTYCKYNKLFVLYKNKLSYRYKKNQLYLVNKEHDENDKHNEFKQIDNNHYKFECLIMYFEQALKTYNDPLYLTIKNKSSKSNYKISYLIEYLTTQTNNINDKKYILIRNKKFNNYEKYFDTNEDKIREKNGIILFIIDNNTIINNIKNLQIINI